MRFRPIFLQQKFNDIERNVVEVICKKEKYPITLKNAGLSLQERFVPAVKDGGEKRDVKTDK